MRLSSTSRQRQTLVAAGAATPWKRWVLGHVHFWGCRGWFFDARFGAVHAGHRAAGLWRWRSRAGRRRCGALQQPSGLRRRPVLQRRGALQPRRRRRGQPGLCGERGLPRGPLRREHSAVLRRVHGQPGHRRRWGALRGVRRRRLRRRRTRCRFPGNAEVCDAAGHDEDCDPSHRGRARRGRRRRELGAVLQRRRLRARTATTRGAAPTRACPRCATASTTTATAPWTRGCWCELFRTPTTTAWHHGVARAGLSGRAGLRERRRATATTRAPGAAPRRPRSATCSTTTATAPRTSTRSPCPGTWTPTATAGAWSAQTPAGGLVRAAGEPRHPPGRLQRRRRQRGAHGARALQRRG
jgi:hypothetical protein